MRRQQDNAVDGLARLLDRLSEFHASAGSTLPDYTERLLVFLRRQGGSATQADVQKHFERSPWAIGRGSRQLARAGLLRVTRASKDGRLKVFAITSKGDRLVDQLISALNGSRIDKKDTSETR